MTKKRRWQTRNGTDNEYPFYFMVEDALGYDEYQITVATNTVDLVVAGTESSDDEDSGSSYTQDDLDAAVEAALADVIDDLVTRNGRIGVIDIITLTNYMTGQLL